MTVQTKLISFTVRGLFGEFNHEIPLSSDDRVTALIGPNGLGKTVCLRLINALFRRQWSLFSATNFGELIFNFSDGSVVTVRHAASDASETEVSDSLGIILETVDPQDPEPTKWSPRMAEDQPVRISRISDYLRFLTRSGTRAWTHDQTGQQYSLQEVIETFGDLLPPQIAASFSSKPPERLAKLIDQVDCHLIETQRLLVFSSEDYRGVPARALAISRKAQALKEIIARELATYASTSQSLDRSFPGRVIQHGPIATSEDLITQLQELDTLRQGLTEAGILDPEVDQALPPVEEIKPEIAAVLSVYVKDTQRKLDVLARLRSKILLFIELIDIRFLPKSVVVDKDFGFQVHKGLGAIPLEKLSSGEQHQLVLFFELLFELKSNALILIDEPELSLHVGWQKKFIPDLKRIIGLNEFDVLLATHSPQLIGEWCGLVVELGDVDPQ